MDKKVIMGGILLVSTILVMYPIITNYLDLEASIRRYGSIPLEILRARDNSRSQMIGGSLLFATLFLMLYYVKLEDGMSSTSTAEHTTLPSTPSLSKSLSKNTTNTIFILSAVAFFMSYTWQMIGVIISTTTTPTPINFMEFLTPVLYSLITSAVVGIIAYFIAKQSKPSTSSTWQHENFSQSEVVKKQTMKKPEQQDWYQKALKQHQIKIDEESSQQTKEESEMELVVEALANEKDWYAVRHGRKFEWSKSMFRFELLRKLVLTNRRIVFLKDDEIDYEIPLKDISKVVRNKVGFSGNPYLRLELKNGEAISITFVCVGVRSLKGIFLLSKQNELTQKWMEAINTKRA